MLSIYSICSMLYTCSSFNLASNILVSPSISAFHCLPTFDCDLRRLFISSRDELYERLRSRIRASDSASFEAKRASDSFRAARKSERSKNKREIIHTVKRAYADNRSKRSSTLLVHLVPTPVSFVPFLYSRYLQEETEEEGTEQKEISKCPQLKEQKARN